MQYLKVGAGRNTELPNEEDKVLVDYCLFMAKSSHPLTVPLIKAFAYSIIRRIDQPTRFNSDTGPSWKWWRDFKKRHPEITLQKPDNLDRGRSRMNNQVSMNKFFELYKSKLDRLDLLHKPDMFNADESGIDLNGKVIVDKKSKLAYSQQKAPRDHITVMVSCSASGQCLKLMIIFEKHQPSGC